MSLDDTEPPVHRISRTEDRERILAEALAHAEALEHQYRVGSLQQRRSGGWKGPTSLLIFVAAAVVAVFPPKWIGAPQEPNIQTGDRERGARVALYLQSQQIEAFRVREGHLPETLQDVPVRLEGVRFIRSDNRQYQLVVPRPTGGYLVYDSAHPAPTFADVAAGWREADAP